MRASPDKPRRRWYNAGMATPEPRAAGAQPIGSIQIVHFALIAGVLTFTLVAIFVDLGEPNASLQTPLLVAIGVLALSAGSAYPLIRSQFLGRLARRRDGAVDELREGRLPHALASLAIVGAALAEGVALLGVVTFMLTRQWAVLAAPALAIVLIALQIPTRERAEGLLRDARG